MRNDKFLENTGNAAFGNSDQRSLHQQTRTAIAGWIVRIGKPGRGKAADNCRVIQLPLLVVSLADHRIAERVEKSLLGRARALVEVAWILFQQRWQNRAVDKRAKKRRRRKARRNACRSLPHPARIRLTHHSLDKYRPEIRRRQR